MASMMVSDNRITSRRYNLDVYDSEGNHIATEEYLTPRLAIEIAAEYREKGYRINKTEVFSVTKGHKVVGEKPIVAITAPEKPKEFGTPQVSEKRAESDRNRVHSTDESNARKNLNKNSKNVVVKNGYMHTDAYKEAVSQYGFEVRNLRDRKKFRGLKGDVVRYIRSRKLKDSEFTVAYIGTEK